MKQSIKYGYLGVAIGLTSAFLVAKNQKLGTLGYVGLGFIFPIIGAAIGNNIGEKIEKKEQQLKQVANTQFQSLDIKNIDKA